MIRRFTIFAAIVCTTASAQTNWPNGLTATFKDGVRLVVHTESTAAKSPLSTSGSVAVNEGNNMHRLVLDRSGHILFGCTVEAWSIPNARDLYFVRINPLDQGYETRLRNDPEYKKKPPVGPDGKIATVAAVRDFSTVHKGEAVSVDILVNPATGERIYDVLEPGNTPADTPRVPVKVSGDDFSLQSPRIVVNGKTVQEPPNNWIIGAAAAIAIPGHGIFYLALEPLPDYNFVPSGRVNREVLTFGEGNDWVEVTSKSNVLKSSEFRTVWVFHAPDYHGQQIKEVMVMTADSIAYLLPKRKKGAEE